MKHVSFVYSVFTMWEVVYMIYMAVKWLNLEEHNQY